jgi:hypothetical protein
MEHNENDQRVRSILSNEDLEKVAIRAAEIVKQDIYAGIGKGVVTKALYIIGAACIALAAWLQGRGALGH